MTLASAAIATSCGRYDCGHVGRSDSRLLKRAAFLFLCETAGVTGVRSPSEDASVMAALALMRRGEACEDVAQVIRTRDENGVRRQTTTYVRPERKAPRVTSGQASVLRLIALGYAIPEVAAALTLNAATVRSHLGYASRNLYTHSALDAAVEATRLGLL